MTPNQQRTLARRPHLTSLHAGKPLVAPPRRISLRTVAEAKRCRHLEPRYVSNGDARTDAMKQTAWALGVSASGCRGNTLMQRCLAGHGVNSFTVAATHCTRCEHHTTEE